MTICRFYANGFCRYGNNCRFEHNSYNNRDYYQKTYNRNDGRNQQPIDSTPNRVGFSFNRTLDSMATNKGFGQQMQFSNNGSNFRLKPTQMSSVNRNVFQSPNNSFQSNQRTGNFSFNRALQQISSDDRPSGRSAYLDDIEMDSGTVASRLRTNSGSREANTFAPTNTFGLSSQPNNLNLFGNKSGVSPQNQLIAKTNQSIDSELKSNDIYSKIGDLSESDKKQFESTVFVYRCIPVCPPPQSLCF